jgi:hypothetical protein
MTDPPSPHIGQEHSYHPPSLGFILSDLDITQLLSISAKGISAGNETDLFM